jgi:hypothetical protein
MKKAQSGTLRLKILKVTAMVKVSARRVVIRLPSSYPYGGYGQKPMPPAFNSKEYIMKCILIITRGYLFLPE